MFGATPQRSLYGSMAVWAAVLLLAGCTVPGPPSGRHTGTTGLEDLDLTVTVPYWTTGDVYLGIGDDAVHTKLDRVDNVTFHGVARLGPDAEYYYSRGSNATRSTSTFHPQDVPRGFNAVIDWADSTKRIVRPGFQKGILLGGHTLWQGIPNNTVAKYTPGIIEYNLDLIKSFGANWIVLDNFWFEFPDCGSAREIRAYTPADGPWPDTQGWTVPTHPDADIKMVAALAHERGFHVEFKPHVVNFANGPNNNVACHEHVEDWEAWFAQYKAFAVHNARLAQEAGIEQYVLATENDIAMDPEHFRDIGPSDPTGHWREIIKAVRAEYKGNITVSVSCLVDAYELDWPCNGPHGVKFWDDLDVIGFEPYFPILSKDEPTAEDIAAAFGSKLDDPTITHARELNQTFHKPIIFTEFAFDGYDGAARYRGNRPAGSAVDKAEQALQFEGAFQAIEERPWIRGVFCWAWYLLHPGEDLSWQQRDAYTWTGGEAGQVIKKWYSKIEA